MMPKFAIRPSIRNHNTLKRDDVIKRIANMVDPQHKVNLGAPDKVILIDIYQVRRLLRYTMLRHKLHKHTLYSPIKKLI